MKIKYIYLFVTKQDGQKISKWAKGESSSFQMNLPSLDGANVEPILQKSSIGN
jgi:hypothetical protein